MLVQRQQVARTFAAKVPTTSGQLFKNIPVTDLGTNQFYATLLQSQLDGHVGHQGTHRASNGDALRLPIHHHQVKQLVTVVQAALCVDQLQPVGITIQRDTVVRSVCLDCCHQRGRRGGAKPCVDVGTVRTAADGDDLGAEFVEHIRGHLVGRAVRRIDHDLHALQ